MQRKLMRSCLPDVILDWFIRLAVGGTFVSAGVLKILDPARFASAVGNYRLASHELINIIAILVPWIETVAGFCVLVGIWLRPGALIVTVMTGIFLLVIASALARGLNIECGCFGTIGGRKIGLQSLVIGFALFCLAALLMYGPEIGPLDGKTKDGPGPGQRVVKTPTHNISAVRFIK
jgi:putative oxidoreductase